MLLGGHYFAFVGEDVPAEGLTENPDPDVLHELLADAWEAHADTLVAFHVLGTPFDFGAYDLPARSRPGTRPWGWWEFDAPERRQTCCVPRGPDVLDNGESQPAFLDRFDLWLPGERELLAGLEGEAVDDSDVAALTAWFQT
jgi:hypothetical protein